MKENKRITTIYMHRLIIKWKDRKKEETSLLSTVVLNKPEMKIFCNFSSV